MAPVRRLGFARSDNSASAEKLAKIVQQLATPVVLFAVDLRQCVCPLQSAADSSVTAHARCCGASQRAPARTGANRH
jgi:hypothetical protein